MNKIMKGVKELKGAPAEIPDVVRSDLPQFFVEMGYKVGAEIGTYQAKFMEQFPKVGLKTYGIDPYIPYKDFDMMTENRVDRQEEIYHEAVRRVEKYGDKAIIVRKTSMDALEDFADESLDFVYIDGNHRFRYVVDDLCEWSKKVRKGGVVSGHDYCHPSRLASKSGEDRWETYQVKFAVDAYMEAFRIKNWYVLGRNTELPGEVRDRFRSWMYIKE